MFTLLMSIWPNTCHVAAAGMRSKSYFLRAAELLRTRGNGCFSSSLLPTLFSKVLTRLLKWLKVEPENKS